MLWIFNHQFGEWEDKLPSEVKQMLDKDRAGQNIHPKGVMERLPFEGEMFDFGGVSPCLILQSWYDLGVCGHQGCGPL